MNRNLGAVAKGFGNAFDPAAIAKLRRQKSLDQMTYIGVLAHYPAISHSALIPVIMYERLCFSKERVRQQAVTDFLATAALCCLEFGPRAVYPLLERLFFAGPIICDIRTLAGLALGST